MVSFKRREIEKQLYFDTLIMDNISIISMPLSVVIINISSHLINDPNYYFPLQMEVRDCIIGEIFINETTVCSK